MATSTSRLLLVHDGKVLVGAVGNSLLAYNCSTRQRIAELRLADSIKNLVVDGAGRVVTTDDSSEVRRWDLQSGTSVKLDGPTEEIRGVQYVEAMDGLVTYAKGGDLFIFKTQGEGKKLEGPTLDIRGVQYVEAMHGLVVYGQYGELFIFDSQGQGKKLEGPMGTINGVQYVEAMHGLVTYGEQGELFIFDAQGQGKKLEGPSWTIDGVQYVEAMDGIVTYGMQGGLFIFDAQGQGKCFEGGPEHVRGVQYVAAMGGLVVYGPCGQLLIFDAQGQGKKLAGPRFNIEGVQYVEAMDGLVTYGEGGELFIFDAQGQGKNLDWRGGPTYPINGVQYVATMHGLVTYGEFGDLFFFDAQGQGKKLEGPPENIRGVQYVAAMDGLLTDSNFDIFIFDAQGQGKILEGPTKNISGVEYVEDMHGLVTYGGRADDLFIFDAQGQRKKLEGPTKIINGVQYVAAMDGLVTYGKYGELFIFDAQGQGKKLKGPTKDIKGVLYAEALDALVTYAGVGDVFIFDAQGQGKTLEGIDGVQYVEALHGLVAYGRRVFILDAQGQGKTLEGPTQAIRGVQYVEAMDGLVTYGECGDLFIFDSQGQGKKLEGPRTDIRGVQYVEAMHVLVVYGQYGELFIFDAQGQGKKLKGPRFDICGVQYVAAMDGLVTYHPSGDVFIFDAQGQGRCLEGCPEFIHGVQYVEAMDGLVFYGEGGELVIFDAQGQGKKLRGPTHGGCIIVRFLESGVVVAGGPVIVWLGASGRRLAMKVEGRVQEIVMLPTSKPSRMAALFGAKHNAEMAVVTGFGVREVTLVNVSLLDEGFLAVRPYSKAVSSKLLDLPKKYGLEVSIASFVIQAGFIVITLLQVLGAAYRDVEPPAELRTPAHALQPLQHMGLDPEGLNIAGIDANTAVFGISLAAVVGMVAIFWAQEFVEFQKFMHPDNSTWPLLFDLAGAYLNVIAGPMFLPLLQGALLPIHQLAVGPSEEETQVTSTSQSVLSLLAGSALTVYALRFTRVDKQLVRIDATGWGMVSAAMDRPPSDEDRFYARRHALAPMSPTHDLIKTLVKVSLVLIRVATTGVVGATFRFLLTVGLVVNDWRFDEFYPNQRWDFNAMVSAGSTAVAWNTLAAVGAAMADEQGKLDDWGFGLFMLNMMSIPSAAIMYTMRKRASKPDSKFDPLSEPLLR